MIQVTFQMIEITRTAEVVQRPCLLGMVYLSKRLILQVKIIRRLYIEVYNSVTFDQVV